MNKNYRQPDKNGHFGKYGGRYIGETLMPAVIELSQAFENHSDSRSYDAPAPT